MSEMDIGQRTFNAFWTIAGPAMPRHPAAYPVLERKFKQWPGNMMARSFYLPAEKTNFQHVHLLVLVAKNAPGKRRYEVRLIAHDGAIVKVMGGRLTGGSLIRLLDEKQQSQILNGKGSSVGGLTDIGQCDLEDFVKKAIPVSVGSIVEHARLALGTLSVKKPERLPFLNAVEVSARAVLEDIFLEAMRQATAPVDLDLHDACIPLAEDKGTLRPLKLYNHIREAKEPQTRNSRLSALRVLKPLSHLRLTDKALWEGVDAGMSLHAALTAEIEADTRRVTGTPVTVATIREAFRRPELFQDLTESDQENLLAWVNLIDPKQWPQGRDERKSFKVMTQVANLHLTTFDRPVTQSLNDMVQRLDKKSASPWFDLENEWFQSSQAERQAEQRLPAAYRRRHGEGRPYDRYSRRLRDISDYKRDVINRLIKPSVLLALNAAGYLPTNQYTNDQQGVGVVIGAIAHDMFADMAPAKQIAASAYWHSERVDFRNRFSSIAAGSEEEIGWEGLTEKAVQAPNGVSLTPLTSATALKKEADVMKHCVWGYTSRCIRQNYHIFSVRSDAGNPLSTLAVIDYMDGAKRKIRLNQNQSIRNTSPSNASTKAIQWFIEQVNDGKIKPDWKAIDLRRAELIQQQVDTDIGYDYRDPAQRQRVFDLYGPCLPPKLLKRSSRTIEGFDTALGVKQKVAAFLANPDVAGIVQIPERPAVRLAAPDQQITL